MVVADGRRTRALPTYRSTTSRDCTAPGATSRFPCTDPTPPGTRTLRRCAVPSRVSFYMNLPFAVPFQRGCLAYLQLIGAVYLGSSLGNVSLLQVGDKYYVQVSDRSSVDLDI